MSFIVTANTFATFESYQQRMLDQMERGNPLIQCPACWGGGQIEDHCDHCDCDHDSECHVCCAQGKVKFLDIEPQYRHLAVTKDSYEKELLQTAKLLATTTNRDMFELLVEAGWNPATKVTRSQSKYVQTGLRLRGYDLSPDMTYRTFRKQAA